MWSCPAPVPTARQLRKVFLGGGAALFAFGMLFALFGSTSVAARQAMPIDFNVNWTAGQRLVDHRPLYDRRASHAEAVAEIGDEMRVQDDCLFCGFVGPPATAMLHAAFLPLGHDAAVAWFRVLAALGMIAAVVVTARVLPPASRLPATLLGLGALLVSFPFANTIDVGQGNEFVMLGIAFGIYGAMRRRWAVCGIGLGVATILKVSPVLLVIYLVARGRRLPALWAAGTVVVLSAVAAVVGRPVELVHWLQHVAPAIGKGSIHVWNQSLVGWLARVTSGGHLDATVQSTLAPIWSFAAYALAAGGALRPLGPASADAVAAARARRGVPGRAAGRAALVGALLRVGVRAVRPLLRPEPLGRSEPTRGGAAHRRARGGDVSARGSVADALVDDRRRRLARGDHRAGDDRRAALPRGRGASALATRVTRARSLA